MMWLPLAFSLLAGWCGAWIMSRYAYRIGLLDIPNDRSSHNLPTPRGGGIGILAAFVGSSVILNLPLFFWLPATFLSLVSFFDDKLGLTPRTRFIFQFAAALAVVSFSVQGSMFIVRNPSSSAQYSTLVTTCFLLFAYCIFIVGTSNFYNFMDGINGIAAITGIVGFGLLSLYAFLEGFNPSIIILCLCICSACISFLPFNVPKARVFMGDVGSILLGFLFASLCVLFARTATDFFVLCGFISTFYIDALTTLYIRSRDGERLSHAHRRHVYQLFVNQIGVSHWKVSLGYGILQSVVGLLLLFLRRYGLLTVIPLEIVLCFCWWIISRHFRIITYDIPRSASLFR